MDDFPIRIGELARATEASVRSLRHYEQKGLLESQRDASGYRWFRQRALTQVREIRRLLSLGFSLDEIGTFPQCMRDDGSAGLCPQAAALHQQRLAEIERQISLLEEQRRGLLGKLK